ncbi:MAG: ankyrin repeat domain-containing protein [Alphaproteobacteria bacterium]
MAPEYGSSFPSRPERVNINLPRDSDGNTYLHELCKKDAPIPLIREAVQKLGANINAVNKKNLPALALAIQYAKPEVVACLLDMGAEMYFQTTKADPFNAIYLAADLGKAGALKTIIEHGGGTHVNDIGMGQDGFGSKITALHIAVKNYHFEMIEPLAEAGAFLNAEAGFDKVTPLFLAIANNSDSGVRKLLNAGADLEHRHSDTGRTPLIYAAYHRDGTAARALIDFGADVNARDNSGQTPLMYAAENGDSYMVDRLVAAKADVNLRRKGNNNETALMKAAAKGSSDSVKSLLRGGADPSLGDAFNKTATQYAGDNYQHGTRFVLEEAEQKASVAHFENTYRKYRP